MHEVLWPTDPQRKRPHEMSERHYDYDDGDDKSKMDLTDGSVMVGSARIKSKQSVGVQTFYDINLGWLADRTGGNENKQFH